MGMTYLSGDIDTIGKKSKSKDGKPKKKKRLIAKIAMKPSRDSFLLLTRINMFRLAKKMAKIWEKPGGKEKLTAFWEKLGGNADILKKAISKGSKQTIHGDEMGVAPALAAPIAAATPLLIALVPLIKSFAAHGDKSEQKEFDDGIAQGKKELAENPDFEKGSANMPEDSDVARLKGKKSEGGETPLGMHTNPISISFFLLLFIMSLNLTNPILSFIALPFVIYAMIGFLIIPFSEFGIAGERIKNISRKYFDVPVSWFFSFINIFSHGKAN